MAKSQERLSTTIQRGQPWCRQHLGWPLNLYHEQTNELKTASLRLFV
jgi:hypothetical protein